MLVKVGWRALRGSLTNKTKMNRIVRRNKTVSQEGTRDSHELKKLRIFIHKKRLHCDGDKYGKKRH